MTRPPSSKFAISLVAGCLAVGLAGEPVRAAPIDTMPIEDVRPGMKGYAVTVFSGSDTDRFEIEVIDVVRDYQPKQDAILFRSSDPRLIHSGIVGGMSGSPIYIDGKLVGALAYGYRFNKDPIGGITPIKNMLAVGDLPYRPEVLPGGPRARRFGQGAGRRRWLGRRHARPRRLPPPRPPPPRRARPPARASRRSAPPWPSPASAPPPPACSPTSSA
jgi:hypothetical protein